MSRVEFHTGKLYPVKFSGSLEDACRDIAKRHNIELGENWREEFRDKFDEYSNKKDHSGEEYFMHGENLYRVIDHEENESDDYFMKLIRNPDGSISFIGQFYNGGTCFSEMLEDAISELNPTYVELISNEIDEIVKEHGQPQPKTVPSAGSLIMKYKGLGRARELFEGAMKETKNDVFKSSAYAATLKSVLRSDAHENN
jgi:hypothetical protein